ncbi:uncharacterized protein LOC133179458 isoform X2 [Saccostrea echinata]|uniref:uncharacterized protein LOC133179458 isoform X2 n=1 Tax=Saccostrea echinata TaxID=191078 RepID=UPI002A7EC56D|nr:uncharacterized protein LOC133179458 isoform X2 [Saccostrea echinata]
MKFGLAGYLYVQCVYCGNVNRIPYGKKEKKVKGKRGMHSFCVNTKLGAAMIDSVGGPQRMNNFLATLDLPTVNNKNLKVMERRAGEMIEKFAEENMRNESQKAFREEMREVAAQEMDSTADSFDKELGVVIIEDEFKGDPSLIEKCNSGAFDLLTEINSSSSQPPGPAKTMPVGVNRPASKTKKKIIFPSKTRSGMTVAADHAWQKRGYDSLTGHFFQISKRNKVLKTVVKHRSCATCKWWKRNRPGQRIRFHRCVWNHRGSARMMESEAGLLALKEMSSHGFCQQ